MFAAIITHLADNTNRALLKTGLPLENCGNGWNWEHSYLNCINNFMFLADAVIIVHFGLLYFRRVQYPRKLHVIADSCSHHYQCVQTLRGRSAR